MSLPVHTAIRVAGVSNPDQSGTYTVRLAGGTYRAMIASGGHYKFVYWRNATSFQSANDIVVDRDLTGIDFTVEPCPVSVPLGGVCPP